MQVQKIDIAQCAIPLPRPIELGPVRITTRDYVAIRISTGDGLVGDALGYPRGTALAQETAGIARFFLGSDVTRRRAAWETAAGRLVNGFPSVVRALSLFDVALTDIAAKAARLPLHLMLGGYRERVPVMAVAGYYLASRTIDDVADEVRALIDAGHPRVKIMLHGKDAAFDLAYATAVAAVAPGRIAVDGHWSWSTVAEALDTCRALDDLGLAFIEDPFGAHRNHLIPTLAQSLRTPIAVGEDMPSPESLLALGDAAKVLRVDATTCGGMAAAMAVIEAAGLRGISVLPHVFPMLHAQLAGATPAISMIEHIPAETGADPIGELLNRTPVIEGGQWVVDTEPGAGVSLDWDAVSRYATWTTTLEHTDGRDRS
jgi:L-alanine-DL-glutamate epimerase-like enolase superfamily enzyme